MKDPNILLEDIVCTVEESRVLIKLGLPQETLFYWTKIQGEPKWALAVCVEETQSTGVDYSYERGWIYNFDDEYADAVVGKLPAYIHQELYQFVKEIGKDPNYSNSPDLVEKLRTISEIDVKLLFGRKTMELLTAKEAKGIALNNQKKGVVDFLNWVRDESQLGNTSGIRYIPFTEEDLKTLRDLGYKISYYSASMWYEVSWD